MIANSKVWHKLLCVWAAGNRVLHLWPGHSGEKTDDRRRKSALTCLQFYIRTIAAIQSVQKLERRSHPRLSSWWEQADQLPLGVHSWRSPPPNTRKLEEHTVKTFTIDSTPPEKFKNESVAGLVHYKWATLPAVVLYTLLWPILSTLADLNWRCTAQTCLWSASDTPNIS